jgi:hypothetical protein
MIFTYEQQVAIIMYLEEKCEADYTLQEVIDELSGRRTSKSESLPDRSL